MKSGIYTIVNSIDKKNLYWVRYKYKSKNKISY